MEKLSFFWNELKSTFWFVPVIILIFSILLSLGLVYIDSLVTISQGRFSQIFFVNSSNSARTILSTISGGMIGVAGTVFSITLVALTLASSQFGPRLINNFMYVRLNQIVLGSYVSTYLYCLFVLNAIKDNDQYVFIPSISILVAILAAIVNIILLIVFIHHIAVSIQADKIIADISDFIFDRIKILFPEKIGDALESEKNHDLDVIKSDYNYTIPIKCPKNGYLQYINSESLIEMMTKYDTLLNLQHRPGSYMVEGLEIGLLHSHDTIDEEKTERILDQFIIGKRKTSQQDIEFSINQMVEIAARALSPGINDPFTAIACIDNLTAIMTYLAEVKFPSKYRIDEENNLRIIADALEFEGVLDAAFNQIRQYSEGNASVIIRLMEALITINKFAKNECYKKAVIKHADMVMRIGEASIKEGNDLEDLTERSKQIISKQT